MSVITVTNKDHFAKLLKENPKVAVDFTATWCGPCKVIGPKFAKLAAEYPDVTFLKVDVDEVSEVAQDQKITAMPTFQFFVEGKQSDSHKAVIGANVATLTAALDGLKKVDVAKSAAKVAPAAATPAKKPEDAAAPAPAAAPVPAPAAEQPKKDVVVEQPKKDVVVDTDKAPAAAPAA
ncbi:glycerol ether metabolic process [Coemansia aciculifera]|uniref:Glycerol ether metabolic process n=1 Tax=Coemansia aciculifera TaxID=417176 RepID=A0ACC1LWJ3_9FUNG|nr:glycerol ether metabolic process [Coemansia aciculifera]KAJ2898134.1 glycerol ether metabolic process [Coemansia aciculifera]